MVSMVSQSPKISEEFEKGIVQGKVAKVHENLKYLRKLRNVNAHDSSKGEFAPN